MSTRMYTCMLKCIAATAIGGTILCASNFSVADTETSVGLEKETKTTSSQVDPLFNRTPATWHSLSSRVNNLLTLSTPARANNHSFLGTETTFKVTPVECNGINIGRMDFLFRPNFKTQGAALGSGDMGGAALEGGFTANGTKPCDPDYKPGTSFRFLQLIFSNDPLGGNAVDTWYVDTGADTWPFYNAGGSGAGTDVYGSNNNNPAKGSFTTSYYDSPSRFEPAAGAAIDPTYWHGNLMLVCTNAGKINLVGSFVWGFQLDSDASTTNNALDNFGFTPSGWLAPVSDFAADTTGKLLRGTPTRAGMAVSKGCCCPHPRATSSTVTPDGAGSITFEVPDGDSIEAIAIFPRNHAIDLEALVIPPEWFAEPSEVFGGAPRLSYQEDAYEMYQDGMYFFPEESIIGPQEFSLNLPLTGHDSFFDIFIMNSEFEWIPWVQETDLLLGDMNADRQHSVEDLNLLETAIFDLEEYQEQFPDINPIFAGDLTHNGSLDKEDWFQMMNLLEEVSGPAERAERSQCPTDIDGNGSTDVLDLLAVLGAWGECEGCPEDIDGNGFCDVHDVLGVIGEWGACSEG